MSNRRSDRTGDDLMPLTDVAEILAPYAEAAIARLNYLYAGKTFVRVGNSIHVRAAHTDELATLRAEAVHALYREKIMQEARPLREAAYRRIFGG